MNRSRGYLVTVEGIDGSGKTTLARHLLSWLEEQQYPALALKEPGSTWLGTWLYEKLVEGEEFSTLSPKAELALFLAARCETIEKNLLPALQEGKVIIIDRFHDSTVAYQGSQVGYELASSLCDALCGEVVPDLTLYIDLPPEIAFQRLKRTLDHMERRELSFFQRVRELYLRRAKEHPERIKILDGTLSKGELFNHAIRWLHELF